MNKFIPVRIKPLAIAVAGITALGSSQMVLAQDDTETQAVAELGVLEETVVTGRLRSASGQLVDERKNSAFAVDLLGGDAIARAGDSDVAAALKRVPGLTLVGGKFIYTRGLGERYSSTTLNGSYVPSPDLSRNVVPLDLFPSDIVKSLSVSKTFAPNLPATFGGGNIDIRTKNIPDGPVLKLQLGTGINSEDQDGLTYSGGSDDKWGDDDGTRAMSAELFAALDTYRGQISPVNILNTLNFDGGQNELTEAETINRELSTFLYRDVMDIRSKSMSPDVNGQITAGNKWLLGEDEQWSVGALGLVSYANKWRNIDRVNRNANNPIENFSETQRTVNSIDLTTTLTLGVEYGGYHSLNANIIQIRSTEDEVSVTTGYSQGFELTNGRGFRDLDVRWEQRELDIVQFSGSHQAAQWFDDDLWSGITYDWYYTDSEASTDIPNEMSVESIDNVDPVTREVFNSRVAGSSTAAVFAFSELTDDVESYGGSAAWPFRIGNTEYKFTGGYDYYKKAREFSNYIWNIGTPNTPESSLTNTAAEVFSSANILDSSNLMETTIGGLGTESYLAAEAVDAYFGEFDVLWNNSWRASGGVRYEQFQQVSIPINLTEYRADVGQLAIPVEQLTDAVFLEDDYYPSLAVTYLRDDFLAEEFQIRFGYSGTVTRPDLREISAASYIDPLTEYRIVGNPNLETAQLDNFDVRADMFYENGDSLTFSLFYKDIVNPIETTRLAGSDNNIVLSFVNAQEAQIYGIEAEYLKELSSWTPGLFFNSNITISESEITVDAFDTGLTNNNRQMTNHSPWVVNFQLGYDSPNEKHTASLVYNVADERLFFAGRDGQDDAFEQSFHAMDFVYSYYPQAEVSVKLKLQNLLGSTIEIEQDGVTIFEQEPGQTISLSVAWEY
jgi:TonB-dependent receptor